MKIIFGYRLTYGPDLEYGGVIVILTQILATMERQRVLDLISTYLQQNGVQKAAVFGSYARGQERADSDIDLLLELDKVTLFDVLRFEEELAMLTQRRIDIVEYRAVKPSLQKSIFSTTIPLL